MTTEEALIKLAESTGEAIGQVLEVVSQSTVERSKVAIVHADDGPLRSVPVPAVIASVSYVDGVTGGNIFVMTRLGVQRLAAAMMGMDAMAVEEAEELSELDHARPVGLDEMVHDLLDGPLARDTPGARLTAAHPVEKFLDGRERRGHALPKLRCGSTLTTPRFG